MLKIKLGTITTVLLSMVLAACGGGLSSSSNPATAPAISTTVTLATITPLVAYNGTAVITWSSANSTSCSSLPFGVTDTSGSLTTAPLLTSTTYTVTCVGPTGNASQSITIGIAGASIVAAGAACAAAPMRGTVYYYCDCGTSAEAGCVTGNDANPGTSAAAPRRTIESAASRFSTLAPNDTVALCKGGAFNSAGNLRIGSNRCGAGVACNDLREYTPTTFVGTAKPIINNAAGQKNLFAFDTREMTGGVRIMNLKLNGDHGPKGNHNWGFFFYQGAHDVTMCNLDMDGFDIAVHSASYENDRIKLTGSHVSNSRTQGYLGSGSNIELSYNYWDGNGSSNPFDHSIYVSGGVGLNIIGNYVYGQYGSACLGAPIVGHGQFTNLVVANNEVVVDVAADRPGCWAIAFDDGGYPTPTYVRRAIFSGNIIRNGGNVSLLVANCPECVIENNLLILNSSSSLQGISVPGGKSRSSPADDVSTNNKIRNNTVWFGPNVTAGAVGIKVGDEGTGHVVANNTVYYSATSAGNGVSCYSYDQPLTSYAFINNNHCYSAAPYAWVTTPGTLALGPTRRTLDNWQSYATSRGFDINSFTSVTTTPLFTAVGTNFIPAVGSPLIGAGNALNGSALGILLNTRANPPAIGAYEP